MLAPTAALQESDAVLPAVRVRNGTEQPERLARHAQVILLWCEANALRAGAVCRKGAQGPSCSPWCGGKACWPRVGRHGRRVVDPAARRADRAGFAHGAATAPPVHADLRWRMPLLKTPSADLIRDERDER
ncbi:MAG: hypothetical protein ACKOYK_10690 [Cyanobium sp.]